MDAGRKAASPPRVGRYDVLLRIASGGMATVYLARASGAGGFEREVALKVTHPHLAEGPELSRQLLEEAKLAVAIRHANVVPVLDVGEEDGSLFLVMEYVEGDTLGGLMRASRGRSFGEPPSDARPDAPLSMRAPLGLPPGIFLRILLDALAGLHAAHDLTDAEGNELHLVHRDFSPQNILIGTDGIGRLTDFGIAKVSSRKATSIGVVKGKISYMSPEQALGEPIDRRTDVWAAGVIAWEAFAGRRLYQAGDEVQTLTQIIQTDAPRLSTVVPDIHPAVEAAVAHALQRDRAHRPPTAASFAKELMVAVRQASIDLADSPDVAAVVKELAGAKLAERRRQARKALTASAAPSSTNGVARKSVAPPSTRSGEDSVVPPPPSSSRPSTRAPRIALSEPPPRPPRTRSIRVGQSAPVDIQSIHALLAPLRRNERGSPTTDAPITDTTGVTAKRTGAEPRRSSVGVAALLGTGFVAATILVAAITRQIKQAHLASAAAPSSVEATMESPPAPPITLPPTSPASSSVSAGSASSPASVGSPAPSASASFARPRAVPGSRRPR